MINIAIRQYSNLSRHNKGPHNYIYCLNFFKKIHNFKAESLFHSRSYLRHVQAHTQHFATVSVLNDVQTVCNGVWNKFSLVWWLCQKCQQRHGYKPCGIKKTARTMGPSKVIYKCVCCSSVYASIEDIRRHVCRVYFAVLNMYLYWFHQAT